MRVGYFVHLHARLHFAGRTSMEVGVVVTAEEPDTDRRWNPCNAVLTFVLAQRGPDSRVPELTLNTPEERALHEKARERYEARRSPSP